MRSSIHFFLFIVLPLLSNSQEKKEVSFIQRGDTGKTWATYLPVACKIIVPHMAFSGILIDESDSTIVLLQMDPGKQLTRQERDKLKKDSRAIRKDRSIGRQDRQVKCLMLLCTDTFYVPKYKIKRIVFDKGHYVTAAVFGSLATILSISGVGLITSKDVRYEKIGGIALLASTAALACEYCALNKVLRLEKWRFKR